MKSAATSTVPGRIGRAAVSCGFVLLLLAPSANALFIVNQPWVRPAARGQSTEVYMNLTSTDGATLVAVRTDEAARVAIVGPGQGATAVVALPLPAGTVVALAPGKARLAFTRLVRSVKQGDLVALTLTIEGADGIRQDIPVQAEVRMRSPLDDEKRAHHTHAH
jgi:copper(I)-binding protein